MNPRAPVRLHLPWRADRGDPGRRLHACAGRLRDARCGRRRSVVVSAHWEAGRTGARERRGRADADLRLLRLPRGAVRDRIPRPGVSRDGRARWLGLLEGRGDRRGPPRRRGAGTMGSGSRCASSFPTPRSPSSRSRSRCRATPESVVRRSGPALAPLRDQGVMLIGQRRRRAQPPTPAGGTGTRLPSPGPAPSTSGWPSAWSAGPWTRSLAIGARPRTPSWPCRPPSTSTRSSSPWEPPAAEDRLATIYAGFAVRHRYRCASLAFAS